MARSSKTGGKANAAPRRKASAVKGGNPAKSKRAIGPVPRKASTAPGATAALKEQLDHRTRERDEALEQLRATYEVLNSISKTAGEPEPVFKAMLESALRICEAKFGMLMLYRGDHSFDTRVMIGAPPPLVDVLQHRSFTPPPGNPLDRMLRTRQTVHVVDAAAEKAKPPSAELAGARSHITVPMLKGNELVGSISIYRTEVRPFTDEQIALLENFASQAVIEIENTRLINETKEALERQTATAEILKVIAASPSDLQPVFDFIVERAVRLCGARMGRVFRYDGNVIQMVAGYGLNTPGLGKMQQVFPRPATEDTIVGQVLQSRQAYFVTDIEHDHSVPALSRQMIEALGTRSQVTVPMLRAESEPIGAITIGWADPGAYQDQQVTLLKTFANQAVIAIENARLFNETKEALERHKRDEIAARQLHVLKQHHAGKLRLTDVKEMFLKMSDHA
jgi:GAF domain-containing protein